MENFEKKKLLLHCCCAPCSTSVLERLSAEFDIVCFFYNPNIDIEEEYEKRKEEMMKFAKTAGFGILLGGYDVEQWRERIKGLESEPEGGRRCRECFYLRLEKTAEKASELEYDCFATTLTVAPMKNHIIINQAGTEAALKSGAEYLPSDFKKEDGYKRSIELSKKYGLYRQNYCGCSFSIRKRDKG